MRLRHIPGSKEKLLAVPDLVLNPETAPKGAWQQYFAERGSVAETL
jgi:hypothetical protein